MKVMLHNKEFLFGNSFWKGSLLKISAKSTMWCKGSGSHMFQLLWISDMGRWLPMKPRMLMLDTIFARLVVVQNAVGNTDEPDLFEISELESTLDSMTHNNARGHDGSSLEIIREIFQHHPQWLLFLYNHYLKEFYFSRSWKRAVAVHFRKEGRNKSNISSYRLICPALGKRKMCATSLFNFLEKNNVLDCRQYIFRTNQSVIYALHEVVRNISELKRISTPI